MIRLSLSGNRFPAAVHTGTWMPIKEPPMSRRPVEQRRGKQTIGSNGTTETKTDEDGREEEEDPD
jgi:hypothetical protein